LIVRALKNLEELLPISVVHWHMADRGWTFGPGDGVIADPVMDADVLYKLYQKADPEFTGRVTVPVLWDRKTDSIVNNESSEIIRIFNSAFDELGAADGDFYPDELRETIDTVNSRVYTTVNNGVYKSGFATTQEAYEEAVYPLFESLDWLEDILSTQRYLAGSRFTEADIRLFTTLARFDAVYVNHFKTNIRRIVDYPNLWDFTREIYQMPKIADTVNMQHIKRHYFGSHETINPHGIVPVGPALDFSEPHTRDRFD
jgi:putative glutathione S-transferase